MVQYRCVYVFILLIRYANGETITTLACLTFLQGDDENLYASIQVLRDRMQDISHKMQSEEKNSRKTINMLSQQTGPSSMEAQQCLNKHEHVMEDLGRQFRQHQNDLMRLQRHRAQKWVRLRAQNGPACVIVIFLKCLVFRRKLGHLFHCESCF